jgi:hypothetical protein
VGILVIALTPFLLKESRANLSHRNLDVAGAVSITGGLMLLVYAMTRAAQHGWATTETVTLLTVSALLLAAFFAIGSAPRRRCCRCGSSGCGHSRPRTSGDS